jgi:hypothetical protein
MREMTDMVLEYSLEELIEMMNPKSKYTGYLKNFTPSESVRN